MLSSFKIRGLNDLRGPPADWGLGPYEETELWHCNRMVPFLYIINMAGARIAWAGHECALGLGQVRRMSLMGCVGGPPQHSQQCLVESDLF